MARDETKTSVHSSGYWALFSHPDRFAAVEAIAALNELSWTVPNRRILVGDKVIVWQVKGRGDRRGVVGLGEVIQAPTIMVSPPEEHRFWRTDVSPSQNRIRFRIMRLPGLPLWESEMPKLSKLAIARARGGMSFPVSAAEWQEIIQAANASPVLNTDVVEGQGFLNDPAIRRAVELHAQKRAEQYFVERGYSVSDVSSKEPYDLHCELAESELHVEVKGTTGNGETVFLTRNEVEHARANKSRMALVIVHGITVVRSGVELEVFGGELEAICPWDVDAGILSPIQFEFRRSAQ